MYFTLYICVRVCALRACMCPRMREKCVRVGGGGDLLWILFIHVLILVSSLAVSIFLLYNNLPLTTSN